MITLVVIHLTHLKEVSRIRHDSLVVAWRATSRLERQPSRKRHRKNARQVHSPHSAQNSLALVVLLVRRACLGQVRRMFSILSPRWVEAESLTNPIQARRKVTPTRWVVVALVEAALVA